MDQYLELYIILPAQRQLEARFTALSLVAMITNTTASDCVTEWTWNGLRKMQLCLTQFWFKLQDGTLHRLRTPPAPHLTCCFFSPSPPPPPPPHILASLSFTSHPSSSRSSSLFSSLSTGWAGQLPEYNLKLWDHSLRCRITTQQSQKILDCKKNKILLLLLVLRHLLKTTSPAAERTHSTTTVTPRRITAIHKKHPWKPTRDIRTWLLGLDQNQKPETSDQWRVIQSESVERIRPRPDQKRPSRNQ